MKKEGNFIGATKEAEMKGASTEFQREKEVYVHVSIQFEKF